MSNGAFKMMMKSGVLRRGDLQIRRGPCGVPLYATRQVTDSLNHSLDVLFGPKLGSGQQKTPKVIPRHWSDRNSPSQTACSRFSLKRILTRLGLLHRQNSSSGAASSSSLVIRLEARIQNLERLLKAEQDHSQAQREELKQLLAKVKRIDILESDLAIERESNIRLVHWLEEAEKEHLPTFVR